MDKPNALREEEKNIYDSALRIYSSIMKWEGTQGHEVYNYFQKNKASDLWLEYIDEDDEPIANDILAYLEIHDDIIFMYKLQDHAYLSHGTTIDALQDRLSDRFPDKRFAITSDTLDETGIL